MSMTLIQHIELGSNQSSITFSSIPATFTDLVIKLSARATSDAFEVQFNGSNANFTGRLLEGTGSGTASFSRTDNFVGYINISSSTANTFGNAEIYVPNYRSSNAKSFSVDAVTENNGTFALQTIHAGLWNQTAAITSVTIECLASGFSILAGSSATLYGITAGSSGGVTVS